MTGSDVRKLTLATLLFGLLVAFPASAADVSGRWSGSVEIKDQEGRANVIPLQAILKQQGSKLTGSFGPSAEQQFAIENGSLDGKQMTFEAAMPTRRYRFTLTIAGENLITGNVEAEDGKASGTLVLKR